MYKVISQNTINTFVVEEECFKTFGEALNYRTYLEDAFSNFDLGERVDVEIMEVLDE